MASHRRRRRWGFLPRGWFGHGRTRALLTLGIVAGPAVGGTTAYWTDTATVTGGSITSGRMDLQVAQSATAADASWGAVGTGTAYAATNIAIPAIMPGESYAFGLAVRNVGAADFTYGMTVTQGGSPAWGFAAGVVTVQVYAGTPNTSDTTAPIQQSCGGTSLAPAATVTTGNIVVIPSGRAVAHGTVDSQLCVLVSMTSSADNSNQGKSGQLRFDATATQVTS